MDWVTTSVLLERLKDVDHDAWNVFVARFSLPVVVFARRLGLGEEEAEDAAQETLLAFARAYREGQYDRTKGRLRSWLFGIARHRVLDVAKRRRSREQAGGADEGQSSFWSGVDDGRDPEETFAQSWRETVFESCLAQVRKSAGLELSDPQLETGLGDRSCTPRWEFVTRRRSTPARER